MVNDSLDEFKKNAFFIPRGWHWMLADFINLDNFDLIRVTDAEGEWFQIVSKNSVGLCLYE